LRPRAGRIFPLTSVALVAGARLKYTGLGNDPLAPDQAATLLGKLDTWENTWFPVVDATLNRHYPEQHSAMFLNLNQTSGDQVLVSVSTLLDRLKALAAAGETATKADALLVSRGLTAEVRKQAADLIAAVQTGTTGQAPATDPASKSEQDKALASAWAWYLEWSKIARTLITRGDILIRLGLRKVDRKPEETVSIPTT
jgi:hypothetical protein